jgi:hypothetical protein
MLVFSWRVNSGLSQHQQESTVNLINIFPVRFRPYVLISAGFVFKRNIIYVP